MAYRARPGPLRPGWPAGPQGGAPDVAQSLGPAEGADLPWAQHSRGAPEAVHAHWCEGAGEAQWQDAPACGGEWICDATRGLLLAHQYRGRGDAPRSVVARGGCQGWGRCV